MKRTLPPLAIVLGIAGLIPFVGCGIAAVSTSDNQAIPALAALLGYGAVILSFLGGVAWGCLLLPPPSDATPPRQNRDPMRLALSVVPALIGWAALVIAQMASPDGGLALLIVGYIATLVAEWHWFRQDLYPQGYMWLRVALSLVVLLTLITVLVLHMLGAKIIL